MEPIYHKNNKEDRPLEHYLALFRSGDPAEMAQRCARTYDAETGAITMDLLGETFTVTHPDFAVAGPRELTNPERILFLRYLLEGRSAMAQGKFLTYREFPWGEVYLRQFDGRCVKRFAFTFGTKPELLEKVMDRLPARRLPRSDAGYELTLMEGLTMQFLLWLGDEEFPPSAQILFSDNFRYAFTAEDMAVIGDIVIGRMGKLALAE